MIEYKRGNLLDIKEGMIVHGCNAQKTMGSGVALTIKNTYPDAYHAYVEWLEKCEHNNRNPLGTVVMHRVNHGLVIANAITQKTYGSDRTVKYVSYDAIHDSFKVIMDFANTYGMQVHIPLIGAKRGGGDWEVISRIINRVIGDQTITCWVYDGTENA